MKKLVVFLVLLGFSGNAYAGDVYDRNIFNTDIYCPVCGKVIYTCRTGSPCMKNDNLAQEFQTNVLLSCPYDDSGLKLREL